MDYNLKDKVAIVTGGGSNIGRGIALGFAREGATVIIAELDEEQGNKVAATIKNEGGKAKVTKTDVTDYNSVQAMVKATVDEFGKVDILVNNVGWDDFTPFIENRPKWDRYININFRSVLNGMHCVLPIMIERKQGRIVNIGSDAGRVGEPLESVYSGCKAGVIGLSKSVAKEVGRHGITINVVCPGATPGQEGEVGKFSSFYSEGETYARLKQMMPPEKEALLAKQYYPLRRLGKAEDIANAVLFFASDNASFITGQTLSVSGGYSTL
jgi:2-hydroxycyclohexanecarboxyl-CoA dehydrogenase